MLRETVCVFAALAVVVAGATRVNPCPNVTGTVPIQVEITGCDEPPCKLKRKTSAAIEQKFTPDRDVQHLITSVNAQILGLPFPFIGVDGVEACGNIYDSDGSNKVNCPLKAGVEYMYKNQFPVLEVYPKISVVVHYALTEGDGALTCFEVPSKIV